MINRKHRCIIHGAHLGPPRPSDDEPCPECVAAYVGWIDWSANAQETLRFSAEIRLAYAPLHALEPEIGERIRLGLGRLVRWADERVRS